MTIHNILKTMLVFILFTALQSCSDFVDEIEPEDSVEVAALLKSARDMDVLINGAYGGLWSPAGWGTFQLMLEKNSDLYYAYPPRKAQWINGGGGTDYLRNYAGRDMQQQRYVLQWGNIAMNPANTVLMAIEDGLADDDPNMAAQGDRLKGEALLVRGIVNWEFTVLLGKQYHPSTLDDKAFVYRSWPILAPSDIPAERQTVGAMYEYILNDMLEAQALLPEVYDESIHPLAYKVRHRKDVATAFLAKVYFQMLNNDKALEMVNMLLGPVSEDGSSKYPINDNFEDVFQVMGTNDYSPNNGSEIIYAAEGQSAQKLTRDSKWGFYRETRPSGSRTQKQLALGQPLQVLFDQDADRRFLELIEVDEEGYWWQNKHAIPWMNLPILRAPEFHLMRAEINARNGNLSDALIDLNLVRNRAGLSDLESTNQQEIIDEIIDERARELFAENVRYLDMLRLGALTNGEVMIPMGQRDEEDKAFVGGVDELPWDSDFLQYDFPSNELIFNPAVE
jgi:hypothetical protein